MEPINQKEISGKITKKDMIEEIKEELVIYFREGRINLKSFFEFDDVRFNNIHDILKIHFILSEEVNEYVLDLEKNIRNIKTSTHIEKNIFHGEIRGSIDWNMTIQHRVNTLYKDKTKFACDNVDKLFDTKENIVLKRAISIIYNIIHKELRMDRFNKRLWYENGHKLSKIIFDIYKSNIYIRKIDISKVKITDKMISDVSKNRNKIYRDSAKIVKLFRDIMDFKKEHINNLFTKTFIDMNDTNEVFELYCIFKYLRNEFSIEDIKFNIVDGDEDCLANLEDQHHKYKIYHNKTGVGYLNFLINISEVEDSDNVFLIKKIKSLEKKSNIYNKLENKNISDIFWGGRPDLLILKINKKDENIEGIVIGEIKYTNNKTYMYQGLEELLEYIYFLKDRDNKYIGDIDVKGVLFIDDIELAEYDFDNLRIINRKLLGKITSSI